MYRSNSSLHNMNADYGLNSYQKIIWFALNWMNNLSPNAYCNTFPVLPFISNTDEKYWSHLERGHSTSRKLCELLLMQLPWKSIQEELEEIHVFDTGCGSGVYGQKLLDFSGGRISTYTGVDNCEDETWQILMEKFSIMRFSKANSSDVLAYIPQDANLLISISALEHFENDLVYFRRLLAHVQSRKVSTIQIHLFPAPSCLKLYFLHGVRQYTPRTVSKIVRIFQPFSYALLLRLGGDACSSIHWDYCSKPYILHKLGMNRHSDLRNIKLDEYDAATKRAIEADNERVQHKPTFWALIIHSYPKQEILKKGI